MAAAPPHLLNRRHPELLGLSLDGQLPVASSDRGRQSEGSEVRIGVQGEFHCMCLINKIIRIGYVADEMASSSAVTIQLE